jgi:hypothetical protein
MMIFKVVFVVLFVSEKAMLFLRQEIPREIHMVKSYGKFTRKTTTFFVFK